MDLTELRRTISLCKEGINSADQNLIKLTGRSYDKNENLPNNQRFLNKRRINLEHETQNEVKKPRNDKDGPSLNSVVQMTKGRTRDDALTELKNKENPKEKERCKRLFGHLMGTLNSIKKDAEKSSNDPQNITRLKIEKKVEAGNKLINETIQKEQNELLRSKRERQNDLKILNQRYRAAEAFDRWRNEKEKMKGFIRTTKTPFVFYRPKIINEEAQLRIDQTTREIDAMIDLRKKKLESEITKAVKYSEQHLDGHTHRVDASELGNESRCRETGEFNTISNHSDDVKKLPGGRGVADSFASEEEDYEDMIEEIEISMHDETAAVHEEEAVPHSDVVADTALMGDGLSQQPKDQLEDKVEETHDVKEPMQVDVDVVERGAEESETVQVSQQSDQEREEQTQPQQQEHNAESQEEPQQQQLPENEAIDNAPDTVAASSQD